MKNILVVLLFAYPLVNLAQNVEEYLESGLDKLNLKNYRGAIQDFNKVIELNPIHAKAYAYRGQAKGMLEDYRGKKMGAGFDSQAILAPWWALQS